VRNRSELTPAAVLLIYWPEIPKSRRAALLGAGGLANALDVE